MSAAEHPRERPAARSGHAAADGAEPRVDAALRKAGLRATRQRRAVLEALHERGDAVTAQQLHRDLIAAGEGVGLSTIYRTLTALADAGDLDTFSQDGEQAFRLCGERHHHHLVCERCGAVAELTDAAVERWVGEVGRRHGFEVTGHRVDLFGRCRRCRSARDRTGSRRG